MQNEGKGTRAIIGSETKLLYKPNRDVNNHILEIIKSSENEIFFNLMENNRHLVDAELEKIFKELIKENKITKPALLVWFNNKNLMSQQFSFKEFNRYINRIEKYYNELIVFEDEIKSYFRNKYCKYWLFFAVLNLLTTAFLGIAVSINQNSEENYSGQSNSVTLGCSIGAVISMVNLALSFICIFPLYNPPRCIKKKIKLEIYENQLNMYCEELYQKDISFIKCMRQTLMGKCHLVKDITDIIEEFCH